MFETITTVLVNALDWIFGWILFLPRDATLVVVAVLTAALLNFIRKWVTDQAWLGQAAADHDRLSQLAREAKARGDRDAVKRHKDTQTLIKMKSMKSEGVALLWAVVPVALLAPWAFARLVYMPVAVGEPVEVRAHFAKNAIGQVVHLAPEPGIQATNGWIQTVMADAPPATTSLWDRADLWLAGKVATPPEPQAVAVWKIVARDTQRHVLKIRHAGRTYEQPFVAGRRAYEAPQTQFDNAAVTATEVALRPRQLFGFVGGISLILLQPWMVAYFLIAIPFVYILKSVFKIY